MLPGLTPRMVTKAGGAPVGVTGNDADTVLLLHLDGAAGNNQYVDYSFGRHGTAELTGNPSVYGTPSYSAFGNGAAFFEGALNESIAFPNSNDWNFGANNFTIDFWFTRQGGGGVLNFIFAQCSPSGQQGLGIYFDTDNKLYARCFDVGGSVVVNIPSLTTYTTDTIWRHVAFVRAGSLFYLFINGVAQGTGSFAGTIAAPGGKLGIGRLGDYTTPYPFYGLMNEMRVSKIARWTGPFTPPSQPYGPSPDFDIKLLLHGDGTTGSTLIQDASMYLKGYATVAGDAKISSAQAMFGQSMLFDGVGDYIRYPNHADYNFGTGDFTIDFWVRMNVAPTTWNALVACIGNDLNDRWWSAVHANGYVYFDAYKTPGPTNIVNNNTPNPITVGVWAHIAIVRYGNNLTMYKDGVGQTVSLTGAMPTLTGPLYVGIGDGTNFATNCFIDELRITKGRARWIANFSVPAAPSPPPDPAPSGGNDTFTKLLCHFDGNYNDSSLAAHGAGTMFGAGSFNGTTLKFGTASFANSQNAYITFPSHADYEFGAGDFTIDMWYYTTAAGSMLARDLSSVYTPFLLHNGGTGPLFYATSTGSSWDLANAQSMGPNTGGRFMHLAVTRQGNTWRTFQDGVKQAEWTAAGAIIGNSNPLCIGAYANANNAGGYTDELRISKGIARWVANFTPPTAPYF